ncbi:MAG TPA: hypothetical protein ENF55_01595 [Thermoprotei archaeon]|nr:hypothetical protein [Thermoprotei archaeon]
MKLVGFIDESGRPVHCCYFTVACLWCIVEKGVSYYSVGRALVSEISRKYSLTKAKELKYSYFRKRGVSHRVVNMILEHFAVSYECRHVLERVESVETRLEFIEKVVKKVLSKAPRVDSITIIIDENPVPLRYLRKRLLEAVRESRKVSVEIKVKSSIKVKGLQLADIIAGYLREFKRL